MSNLHHSRSGGDDLRNHYNHYFWAWGLIFLLFSLLNLAFAVLPKYSSIASFAKAVVIRFSLGNPYCQNCQKNQSKNYKYERNQSVKLGIMKLREKSKSVFLGSYYSQKP